MPFAIVLDEKDQEVSREELDRRAKPQGGYHKRLDGNYYKFAGDPRSMDAIVKKREEERIAKEEREKAEAAKKQERTQTPVQQHQSSTFRNAETKPLPIFQPLNETGVKTVVGYTNTKVIRATMPMSVDRIIFRCYNFTKNIDVNTGVISLFGTNLLDGMGIHELCKHDWFAKIEISPRIGTMSFWLFSPTKEKPDIIVYDAVSRERDNRCSETS